MQLQPVQADDLLHYLQTSLTMPQLASLSLAHWLILGMAAFGVFALLLGALFMGWGRWI